MNEVILFLVALLMGAMLVYVRNLKGLVTALSTNPNFGVTTRIAALTQLGERRAKGGTSVITFDVAGMGKANQAYGEQFVNEAIRQALAEVRSSLRSTDMVAQLNSGDEFFVVTSGDVNVVMSKIEWAFGEYWDGGIYIASAPVTGSIMEAVTASMEKVYAIKAVKKGL